MNPIFQYPVDLDVAADGVTVTFPDVPEAITEGADVEEALRHAVDALETALEIYAEAGQPIPQPSHPKPGQRVVQVSWTQG